MSGSFRLQQKQIKDCRKQPQRLLNANLPPDKSQFPSERINQLSNLQQKSFIASQASGHDKQDIKYFIANIKDTQPADQGFTSLRRNPSIVRRIQDQEIIIVQQQNEIGSYSVGKESVILEHIEFNFDEKQPHEAEYNHSNNYKHQGVNYTINCVEATHFLVNQHENESSSSSYEFSSRQLKKNKNRNSKNTCIQRVDPSDSNHAKNVKPTNKSCIDQPISRANSRQSDSSLPSNNQLEVNNFLNKWNNYIYPQLANQYLKKQVREEKRKTIHYDIEKQAKYCLSNYQNPNSRLRADDFSEVKSGKVMEDKEIQTEGIDSDYRGSDAKVKLLHKKGAKYELEKVKTIEDARKMQKELTFLKENLNLKSAELQTLKFSFQQKCKQSVEEIKELVFRNTKLQKHINDQNSLILHNQQKQQNLQKKLQDTVGYADMYHLRCKCMKIQKLNIYGTQIDPRWLEGNHEACNAKIQSLHEYIFDFEQQRAGINLELQKRLRMAIELLQKQISTNIRQKYDKIVTDLKQENKKLKQANVGINWQRKQMIDEWQKRQMELNEKQQQLNSKYMYNESIAELKEVGRQHQKSKRFATGKDIQFFSPKASSSFSYQFTKTMSGQDLNNPGFHLKWKKRQPLSRKTLTPTNAAPNYSQIAHFDRKYSTNNLRLPPGIESNIIEPVKMGYERMAFGKQTKQKPSQSVQSNKPSSDEDLHIITSKIERLKCEINRQLNLIH